VLGAPVEEQPARLDAQHPHDEFLHAEVDESVAVRVVVDEQADEVPDGPLDAGRVVEVADVGVGVRPRAYSTSAYSIGGSEQWNIRVRR